MNHLQSWGQQPSTSQRVTPGLDQHLPPWLWLMGSHFTPFATKEQDQQGKGSRYMDPWIWLQPVSTCHLWPSFRGPNLCATSHNCRWFRRLCGAEGYKIDEKKLVILLDIHHLRGYQSSTTQPFGCDILASCPQYIILDPTYVGSTKGPWTSVRRPGSCCADMFWKALVPNAMCQVPSGSL